MPYRRFDVPTWRFVGVDPSAAMLAVARTRLEAEGLLSRSELHVGELHNLPGGPPLDGAQRMGVLHHVTGEEARLALLRELNRRVPPGAPVVIGCRVGKDPVLWDIELARWRAHGVPTCELEERRKRLSTLQSIESDAALFAMLAAAGFEAPRVLSHAQRKRRESPGSMP